MLLAILLAFTIWNPQSNGCGLAVETRESPKVRVAEGMLRGRRVASKAGGKFFSFQGVPYAKPPIGPMRFKDAREPESWNGIRDATKEGPVCPQYDPMVSNFVGNEDCLFLNIYTPQLPEKGIKLLPVMVWFHGGSFVFRSGGTDSGPDFMVSENVLMVTLNFRLGPLGFLYLHDAAPGNAGLKDQVMALRWIQKNVAAFGGDPNKITIFGESGGAASVHMHTLSPMSKGLFHGAIAQSGSALMPWVFQHDPVDTTTRLANAVGCSGNNSFATVECLRQIDSMTLIRAATFQPPSQREQDRLVKFIHVPTVEFPTPGVEMFLPKPVKLMLDEGLQSPVPYMTGLVQHEGIVILALNPIDFNDEKVLKELDISWNKRILPELRLSDNSSMASEALSYLREFYMRGQPLSKDTLANYVDMFGDLSFGESVLYTIKKLSQSDRSPLYVYSFEIDGKLNYFKSNFNFSWPGAVHADELGYLFLGENTPQIPENEPAGLARRMMVRLWTNFAKTGNPTPEDDSMLGVQWKPYSKEENNFLQITDKLISRTNFLTERYDFWNSFYRKFGDS